MEVDATQWFYGAWAIIGVGVIGGFAVFAAIVAYEWFDEVLVDGLYHWHLRRQEAKDEST